MALAVTTVYELNASATANNVNAGGFNPSNANMPTDLAATSATGNDAVVTSATYTFAAADVGHWLYVKSGTNWTPGWYKIASVDAGAATLDSAIGEAVQVSTTEGFPSPRYKANTVAGVATVASPSSGTFAVDYSQGTAAIDSGTDLASADGDANPATITSASHTFTAQEVGNLIHITAGTGWTAGWYEIVSVSGGAATVDRAVGSDGAKTNGTWYLGGAMSLNSTLDDDFFELMFGTNGTGGNRIFVKNGSFTLGEAIALGTIDGASQANVIMEGYNSLRGDTPTGSNRPTINGGANAWTGADYWGYYNINWTGTAGNMFYGYTGGAIVNCKFKNTSTTASRNALVLQGSTLIFNNEIISYRGTGVLIGASTNYTLVGNWIHDSNIGILFNTTSSSGVVSNNIISSNVTYAIQTSATAIAQILFNNNTIYGSENTTGTGFSFASGTTNIRLLNNIIYGFATGASHADASRYSVFADYNDFYNNDTNRTDVQAGANDVAVDPSFTSVSQVTGTTATYAGTTLTDAGKFGSVVAGRDYIYIVSGTGMTAGIYGISSATANTVVTDIDGGESAGGDIVYQITIGQNFLPTGSI